MEGGMFAGLWQGIAQTFTAGKDVNLGQMQERAQKRQIEFDRFALASGERVEQLRFVNAQAGVQNKLNMIIIIAVVLLLAVAFYAKFK